MKLTSLYCALLTLIYIYLSMRVIQKRRILKISIGHVENPEMLRAIRAHSNFIEYVPLALISMLFLELNGVQSIILHFLGILLLLSRSLHAYGVSQINENFRFRVTGMAMTFSHLITSSILLLYYFIKN